ncbi:hypothetical protein GYMLUDRAFT_181751 [Collybiopsis luxurians FD-317 M1]|uniref:Glutaminase A N-terminal domain-containing protein n=1 Tax=Collybiopsis luxurians FD-317 M1 TaxID=944289 RepID=A0A0D0BNS9_9AGAR|nr:hypothetical protein GYMLUDRAFT_181751 [Collybiopsis luxurians FD-317 M1]
MMLLLFLPLAFWFVTLTLSQSIQPPAIPLAVRSPYLQAYFPYTTTTMPLNGSYQWPRFWTERLFGWCGLLLVNGALYSWLGEPLGLNSTNSATSTPATLDHYQVTPTCSILSLTAGSVAITVTFLSPIEPKDLALQSFPFTYIYFEASSKDGRSHSLQLYQDITREWLSSDSGEIIQWNTTRSGSIIYHQANLSSSSSMMETNNMAEDGKVYFATNTVSDLTYETGQETPMRNQFFNNGKLSNTPDMASCAIEDNWPIFAFSQDLGNISSTSLPVVWALGLVRDPDISYASTATTRNQPRCPYFFTKYPEVATAVCLSPVMIKAFTYSLSLLQLSNFMNDLSNALQCAITLDNQILVDANKILTMQT